LNANENCRTEGLGSLQIDDLIDQLVLLEDRAPRTLIDECARRGAPIVERLKKLTAVECDRDGSVTDGEWWLRLHAVMILGLVADEPAGLVLIESMRRMSAAGDDNLQDWLAGYWPALFRNKPADVMPALRALCEDRQLDWYIRANGLEAVVGWAQRQGMDTLNDALDWAAGIAADAREDREMRLQAGNTLLNCPRDRHRTLLDGLAAGQTGFGRVFSSDDVQVAFDRRMDESPARRRDDPWQFYLPAAIEARQQRWAKEDAEADAEAAIDDYDDDLDELPLPYKRNLPKIGRNDPCPCGSGKKYKKCCLSGNGPENVLLMPGD
jgi:hypothetical protein